MFTFPRNSNAKIMKGQLGGLQEAIANRRERFVTSTEEFFSGGNRPILSLMN
jgi:hypothetical protein